MNNDEPETSASGVLSDQESEQDKQPSIQTPDQTAGSAHATSNPRERRVSVALLCYFQNSMKGFIRLDVSFDVA